MDKYTATEMAYKHGYEKGYEAGKPKWIPVSERLPEKCETVLCLLPTKECWVATWNIVDDQMWSDGESWCSKDYVTNWMPLPEPPKEGE